MADDTSDIQGADIGTDAGIVTTDDTAAFDAIMDRHGIVDEADPAIDVAAARAEAETDQTEASTDEEEAAAPAASEPEGPDRATMRRALLRDNVPAAVIEKMLTDDPATLRAWYEQAAKRQADTDRAFGRLKELEKPVADETGKAPQADQPDTTPAAGPDLGEVRAKLAEYFGEEEAQAVERLATALVQPHIEALQKQIQSAAGDAGAAQMVVVELAQQALADEFPGLSEADNAAKVQSRMEVLLRADLEHYQNAGRTPLARAKALMRDACLDVFRNETRARVDDVTRRTNTARNASQPTVSSRSRPGQVAAATEAEKLVKFERLREQGVERREALRLAGLPDVVR